MRAVLTAPQAPQLAAAFKRSSVFSIPGAQARPVGVAWTMFGNSVALLSETDAVLTLQRLILSSDASASADCTTLMSGLAADALNSLIAPPIAGRVGTALVTDRQLQFFPHPEARMPTTPQRRGWPSGNERIRAAALSPSADIYLAVAENGGPVTIRDQTGEQLAEIEEIRAEPNCALGMAVQGRRGDTTAYVWGGGTLAWCRIEGGTSVVNKISLPELPKTPLFWRDRLVGPHAQPVAWHSWRDATCGVYPMLLEDSGRRVMGALILGEGSPSLARYCEGVPTAVVSGAKSALLVVDDSSLRVFHPRTGALVARRQEKLSPSTLFVGLSSGDFLSLSLNSVDTVLFGAWRTRDSELIKAFEVELRADGGQGAPLQLAPELGPHETDDGLAVIMLEGAGGSLHTRLWCERNAFFSQGAS
jgi:hypothetical protein